MASASSSSLDMEGLATINFEIANANKSNNNIQLHDMANRENDFWAQPQEEPFYTPQPLSGLVGPLPFTNTIYINGQHYLPTDADLIFSDSDSDDESLEPFEIETVNDTELEIGTVDDTDMFADMGSPSTTASLDSDSTEEPVIETVDETDMFAELRSPSTTSSLDSAATDEYSSTVNDGIRTVMEESWSVIREYEIIRDEAILMMNGCSTTADEPRDIVDRSSRWDSLPCFSDSELSLTQQAESQSGVDSHGGVVALPDIVVVSINRNHEYVLEGPYDVDNNLSSAKNTTVSSTTSPSDISMSEAHEADFLDTRVVKEKSIPKWEEITDDARSSLGAHESASSGSDVDHGSVDIQILLREALMELNHIYHIDENWEPCSLPDDRAVHGRGEGGDRFASGVHIPWNVDSNRDTINRWLYQNDLLEEDDITQFPHSSYYGNNIEEFISVKEPRFSQSAVDMHTANKKRKLEDDVLESRSDTFLISRQITRAKRRRIYQDYDQGEDEITCFYHQSYSGNNEQFKSVIGPKLSQSAVDMRSANKKRKMDEMDDEVIQSKSDTFLMNRQVARAKRRRI